jgi:hypothetical protein
MNILDIKYHWSNVQITQGYNYQYPSELSGFMNTQYCRPAVYRWVVWAPTRGLSAFYIGETEDLARRIGQCLSPGKQQATNLRLKAYFDSSIARNELVELQTIEFEEFSINQVVFSMDKLAHAHIRRMLENLVLVWLHSDSSSGPPLVLNRVLTRDIERSRMRVETTMTELKKLGLTDEQIKQVVEASMITKKRP